MSGGWVAIVNPTCGRGLPARALSRLVCRLREVADPVLTTEYQGHAQDLAQQFGSAKGVVVGGGDGTLFEVLQTLRRDCQQVVIIPIGRGNSLARDLGAFAPETALSSVASGTTMAIDLLAVSLEFDHGDRWTGLSASNVGVGYPAEIVRLATRHLRWAGRHCYALAAVATGPSTMTMRVSYDGEPFAPRSATGLIVSNTRHIGPFEGFPDAELTDGLCESMELRGGWLSQNLHNLSVLTRWHGFCPASVRRVRTVTAVFDEPTVIKIDGELRPGVRRVEVGVLPASLSCRVPRGAHV